MMEAAPLHAELAQVPDQGRAFWTHASDGTRLRVASWEAGPDGKGSVLLLPGRTQYIELHGRTVEDLRRRGYGTLVLDWRGHGLSDAIAADSSQIHVHRFSDYQWDIAAMLEVARALDMPQPWYLFGSSLGGCIGLRALTEGLPVAACAFTGPMWGIKLKPAERLAAWAASFTALKLGRGETYCPGHDGRNYALSNPFDGNRITGDAEMYRLWRDQARARPDLQRGGSSMGWLFEALAECRRLSRLSSPDIACIAFRGDLDGVVDARAVEDRMARWPRGRAEHIRNARHELLLEAPAIREGILDRIVEAFSQHRSNPA